MPKPPRKRERPPSTEAELEAFWRKDPGFIGPVGPPMWLWLRDRERQEQWEIEMSLRPRTPSSTTPS